MRLVHLSLAALFLISSSLLAQHSSGGGSAGSSSASSSFGGGSHSSSSGGSSYSGGAPGGSHSSGGGYSSPGGSYNSGGGHNWSGGHSGGNNSGASRVSGGASVSTGSTSPGKTEHGTMLVNSPHNVESSSSKIARPIREPKPGTPDRAVMPQRRGFFSLLRHPFRKPQPKLVEARPALFLPRPICVKGRCVPTCPVGQVNKGGACTAPIIPLCEPGQSNGACTWRSRCTIGQVWNGGACVYGTHYLDNCIGLRMALDRQAQRVQAAESARQSACANGPAQECSSATSTWQSEESLRQNLLRQYQKCRLQSIPMYSAQYGLSPFDSIRWLNSLEFNVVF